MKTLLLPDIPPCANDARIGAELGTLRVPGAATMPPMRIGVEGRDGRIHRIIELTSLLEAVRLFELLQGLGLHMRPGRRLDGMRLQRVFG